MIASRNQFSPNEKKINDENQPGIVAEPVRKKSEDWKVNQSNGEAHSGGRNLRKGDGAGKQPFSSDSLNKTFIKSARAILSNKKQNSKGQEYADDILCMKCLFPVQLDNVAYCKNKPCGQIYHSSCLQLNNSSREDFVCEVCLTDPRCFLCQGSGEIVKCSMESCVKRYHLQCMGKCALGKVINGPLGGIPYLLCPLHYCVSCAVDENAFHKTVSEAGLLRCIICPTAYHNSAVCLPAGTEILNDNYMVCCSHFNESVSAMKHTNVNWCFICGEGGELICCELCPAAVHQTCLAAGQLAIVGERFYCRDCQIGKRAKTGDIVWVKLGSYRWWPACVVSTDCLPSSVRQMERQIGEFPVQFFGSNDHYWVSASRSFLFHDGDKGARESIGSKGLTKLYREAVQEAIRAFAQRRGREINCTTERKPASFKHIKVNRPHGRTSAYRCSSAKSPQCDCQEEDERSCGDGCVNRSMCTECHPEVCVLKEKCQNQRFQRCSYAVTTIFHTSDKGWGLKSCVEIKKGDFVIEYVGELIDEEECHRRLQQKNDMGDEKFYFLTLDKGRIIDAEYMGNRARFMNHSCDPNCETQPWLVFGDSRIGLFARRDIAVGEELTFHYNLSEFRSNAAVPKCVCQSSNCCGIIGRSGATVFMVRNQKLLPQSNSHNCSTNPNISSASRSSKRAEKKSRNDPSLEPHRKKHRKT